jgi:hypothetical protein
MGALQSRARNALNKLSFFLGDGKADRKAAEDQLQKQFGTRDPLSLNDDQAKQFAQSVFSAYGSFRPLGTSPSDNDREPLVPAKGKPKIDSEFTQAAYRRFNRIKAGVDIRKVEDDE